MQEMNNILADYPEREKSAYLSALASLATADREASEEEIKQFTEMSEAAGLSAAEQNEMLDAANDLTGQNLTRQLDVLKESDLKYALITDLMALSKSDGSYSQEERNYIQRIASYLSVDDSHFNSLDQAIETVRSGRHTPDELSRPGLMDKLGLPGNMLRRSSGQGGGSVFGLLVPIILGSMASGMGRRGRSGLGRGLGDILGGSGLGRRGATGGSLAGGLGSLVSGITRSRSNNSIGGMLSRILR